MFEVDTEDGWKLPLFHITGKTVDGVWQQFTSTNPPLHMQHGFTMSAGKWMSMQDVDGLPLMLELADQGYDVWMGSNRGSLGDSAYCASSVWGYWGLTTCFDTMLEQYRMGEFDDPAFINKVILETGQPKVTYIGYSLGTT